ncbi:hypothetical protein B0H15DRAFT_957625 [Mycena belliarum]|uniref:Uncharacterized protein n=1 Tax=Mycena belliarum TaxID=1033014 RepID=A0AAD6TP05_9AGAR|nr:hypothetical protein B0H15DRAFT_957625 [Mycena belliae]
MRAVNRKKRIDAQRRHHAVSKAISVSEGAIQYQFELRRAELLQLCVMWKTSLDRLGPGTETLPAWGPTPQELLDCQISDVTPAWGKDYGSDDEEDDALDEEDDDLFQVLEAVDRADYNRGAEDNTESLWASDNDDF